MTKKVFIETDECIGCRSCVKLCPDVFEFNQEARKSHVKLPEGGDEECIDEAISDCPVECIHWEDVKSTDKVEQTPNAVVTLKVEQTTNAVVTLRNEVSPWLMILQVVPDGWDFPDFIPGQFTSLGLLGSAPRCVIAEPEKPVAAPDELIKRAYGISSSSVNREFLEFYVALVPDGALTPRLFSLKIGDRIWLSPKVGGKFTYDESRVPMDANMVLIATGSGLGPFMSMLSTHLKLSSTRRITVIHGVRHSWDLGFRSTLLAMQHLRTNFTYIPVVSRPQEEPVPWKGATGHVQDVWKSGAIEKALSSRPGPENTHVFMCGSPQMSEAMITILQQEGFKEDEKKEPGQIHMEKYW
jgi:ferredoxin--NADP+ reductase